ncbi:uncharacterized protein IL334_007704 [Kwoniella shivajii]|uniref:C-CAP/cofactor C-like domain-containing protein n=1 Tax=Kwoniella shivajii TaxID=564305 RepID=A0ABZ1D9D6_9TREE|nr:hypothetical protein IL334_007704 [Kwoniella shivajii]
MSSISVTQAGEFHAHFQSRQQDIVQLFESSNPNLVEISKRISSLRNDVNGILDNLPLYDRGRYEKQLSELESKLSIIRIKQNGQSKSKSKFSFAKSSTSTSNSNSKSSSNAGSASPIPPIASISTSTSTSISTSTSTSPLIPPVSIIPQTQTTINDQSIHTISDMTLSIIRPPTNTNLQGSYTISLTNLDSCIIDLRSIPNPGPIPIPDHISTTSLPTTITSEAKVNPVLNAIHVKGLKKCILLSPIIGGSALLDDVQDCLLVLGCQQFRIHSSTNTTVLLNVASLPIIEYSKSMKFGSYPTSLVSTDNENEHSNINHTKVQDFDWPLPTPSPNWSSISDKQVSAILSESDIEIINGLDEGSDVAELLNRLLPSL